MTAFAGIAVEGAARAWVQESLGEGLGLAARLLARIEDGELDATGGRVLALAGSGPGADAARLGAREALEEGVEGSLGGAVAELAALLGAAGARGPGRVLVVEDELSFPHDPALEGAADGVVTCGAEVFHWRALGPGLDAAALTELLGSATSGYPTNAVVTVADPAAWTAWADLGETGLDALAAAAEAVIVAAYDAEGLLWWELPGA